MKKHHCKIWALIMLLVPVCSQAGKNTGQVEFGTPETGYIAQGEYSGQYWPTKGWKACKPEAVGMDSEKLLAAVEYAVTPAYKTDGMMIVRSGHIVAEAYPGNFGIESRHVSNSMAKSFTSAIVGIAIDKGFIPGIETKLCHYYEDWDCADKDDPRSRITLRHALTLTTGLEWHEDWTRWDPANNDALKMGASGHYVKYMSHRNGLHEPGKKFIYSTGDPMLLSKVIQDATGKTALEFARQILFAPLNITNVRWDGDRDGYTATAWGLYTTTRNFAKFGFLYLKKGRWEDRQIVPEKWVEQSTQTDSDVNMWKGYGYLWHVNLPLRLSYNKSPHPVDAIPEDGYMAEGTKGQNIFIIPSKDLVIVRLANQQSEALDLVRFLNMVLDAVKP